LNRPPWYWYFAYYELPLDYENYWCRIIYIEPPPLLIRLMSLAITPFTPYFYFLALLFFVIYFIIYHGSAYSLLISTITFSSVAFHLSHSFISRAHACWLISLITPLLLILPMPMATPLLSFIIAVYCHLLPEMPPSHDITIRRFSPATEAATRFTAITLAFRRWHTPLLLYAELLTLISFLYLPLFIAAYALLLPWWCHCCWCCCHIAAAAAAATLMLIFSPLLLWCWCQLPPLFFFFFHIFSPLITPLLRWCRRHYCHYAIFSWHLFSADAVDDAITFAAARWCREDESPEEHTLFNICRWPY